MPSLAVDALLCVLLVAGAYILFGPSRSDSVSKSSNKKKKRSKANKKTGTAQVIPSDVSNKPSVKSSTKAAEPGLKQSSSETTQTRPTNGQAKRENAPSKQTSKKSSAKVEIPEDSDEDEEFPALTSSYAARASKGTLASSRGSDAPKPLAERKAKALPKTAVDDMVEKDDALQGQQSFSRTMRIVKPVADKPLLLDEENDAWNEDDNEGRRESAWESVPVSNKKSSTIRISSSSSFQSSPQAAPTRSVPGLPEQTKKQRQNARKAAEAKAAKEQAEHDRLQRLALHKRNLENEKMNEQFKQKSKTQAPYVQKSKREEVGGGMQAKVYDGQLIWE